MFGSSSHNGNRRRLIFRPSPESRIRDAIWFQANLWQRANYMPLPVMPRRTNSRIQIAGRSSLRERRLASRWPIRLRKKPARPRCSPASTRWSNEPFAARQLTPSWVMNRRADHWLPWPVFTQYLPRPATSAARRSHCWRQSIRRRTWLRRRKPSCPSPSCCGRCSMSATSRRARRRPNERRGGSQSG
jgi:hypothetical protein